MLATFQVQHRRRRTALLVVLAGTAALSLQSLLTPQLWDVVDNVMSDGSDGVEDDVQQLSLMEEAEMEDQFERRMLLLGGEDAEDEELLAIPGEEDALGSSDNGKEAAEASALLLPPHAQLIDANLPLPQYTIEDAIDSSKMFEHTFALMVYDPNDDAFYGLYSKRNYWVSGCEKLLSSFKNLAHLLRTIFPERFQGKNSEELIIPISSGDYPGVRTTCLDHFRQESTNPLTPPGWQKLMAAGTHCSHNTAPILHFGSVFRQPHMFPNVIAMPMPAPHSLFCFVMWATDKVLCPQLRAARREIKGDLVFGEEFGLEWEDLIPQVVWRGTDFNYLAKVHPLLDKPRFQEKLVNWPSTQERGDRNTKIIGAGLTQQKAAKKLRKLERVRKRDPKRAEESDRMLKEFAKAAAVQSMKEQYKNLLPRWKAVVLTAEAEVEAAAQAQPNDALPWANMRFSGYTKGGSKARTIGSEHYKEWEKIGFATGKYMDLPTLAKYKYQIDLGGGGGTTWSGTIQKLAMPGLLFHHMTPTKDYIHDWMKPWVHYIPISSDLHDLKRKFDWAESHPEKSKKMADESTKLMRYLTSPEGYEKMFQHDMVEPLRRVIEAYQPLSTIHSRTSWKTWREAIREIEGDQVLLPVIKCTGFTERSCEELLGKKYIKNTLTHHSKRQMYGGG